MHVNRRSLLATMLAVVGLCLPLYSLANPGVAACALIDVMPAAAGVDDDSSLLTTAAQRRIQDTFGDPLARPTIVFWRESDLLRKLHLNAYASAHFIGNRACIFIGPHGRSVDVVAHELMHAEISERIGAWARMTQLPTWFDEGLAMQVDFREKYSLTRDASSAYIRNARYPSQFFVENDDELTRNYAAARVQVAEWVAIVGASSVYAQLARIRSGEPFVRVVAVK